MIIMNVEAMLTDRDACQSSNAYTPENQHAYIAGKSPTFQ